MLSVRALFVAAAALATLSLTSAAFEVTFPNNGDNGYWVACQTQILNWSANRTDPDIFSVALLSTNQSQLNGNYQIANSLTTPNGTANISPNCVAPGTYRLLLVNASHYALDRPEVYYETPVFEIKPNGTELATGVRPNTGAFNNPPSTTSRSNSEPTASPTGTAGSNRDSAAGLVVGIKSVIGAAVVAAGFALL